ncbi:chaperone protein [Paraphaeosphaeria sporulosa]
MEDFIYPFKYPEKPDYYADLGLHYTATLQEIKRAHNSLAKRYHPDKQGFGVCVDASEFRKIREAYEFLRDPSNRLTYDADYPRLRECWTQFHAWQETNSRNKRLQRAEHIERQRKAAEAEQARQAEETQRAAREKAEREKEAVRAREERLAREKHERERVRKLKEERAEERMREAARKARKGQEHAARERLRIQKQKEAEKRSREAASRARRMQEQAAEARLKAGLRAEEHDIIRQGWAKMREVVERRQHKSTQPKAEDDSSCDHPPFGWPKKKGNARCIFCGRNCSKFYFHCPDCDSKACKGCKIKSCRY